MAVVRTARIALALYLVGVAVVTLGERPAGLFRAGLRGVRSLTGGLLSVGDIEAVANVAMFVPLAFLLCRSLPGVRRVAVWALCVGLSTAVELYQWIGPSRDATPRDVLTNALGAAIGVGLDVVLSRLLARRARAAAPGGRPAGR
ncbi:VanZ family protein [Blastococcus sp. SYSU D00695]